MNPPGEEDREEEVRRLAAELFPTEQDITPPCEDSNSDEGGLAEELFPIEEEEKSLRESDEEEEEEEEEDNQLKEEGDNRVKEEEENSLVKEEVEDNWRSSSSGSRSEVKKEEAEDTWRRSSSGSRSEVKKEEVEDNWRSDSGSRSEVKMPGYSIEPSGLVIASPFHAETSPHRGRLEISLRRASPEPLSDDEDGSTGRRRRELYRRESSLLEMPSMVDVVQLAAPVSEEERTFALAPPVEFSPPRDLRKMCLTMEPPKLEQIKKWTITNYKYTKQLVGEKLGNTTKTVDRETDERIAELRVQKAQFAAMLRESRGLYTRFESLLNSHQLLRTQFNTMVSHAPDLAEQLQANSTTQLILERNGKGLLGAIKTFVDTLHTLVNVTMQDTILTVKNYENARIEYDAYRNELTTLQNTPAPTEATKNKLLELQVIFDDRKQKWERLMQDTHTKMNLLNENRNAVMKQQLEMFNSAVIAYFSGNGEQLSDILSEYHIKTRKLSGDDDTTTKSFLAQQQPE